MDSSPAQIKRSRWRRAAQVLAWFAALVAALVFAASLYVQTPSFRSSIVSTINRRLAGSVRGQISLDGLTRLGLTGAHVERVRVSDERGEPVLELEGVTLSFDLFDLLGPWLPTSSPRLDIDHVRVNRSLVRLVPDPGTGEPTLLRALVKDKEPKPGDEKVPLNVGLSSVELGLVEVSLEHETLGRHDVRLDHARGSAQVAGEDTEVDVQSVGVLLLEGGERWLEGTGSFRLLPKRLLGGSFHGFVRGTELDLGVQLDADVLAARLDVPNATPERLRELWPDWPWLSPVAARVTARGPLQALALDARATSEGGRVELRGNADLQNLGAHFDVEAHALDARSIARGAPQTALDARAGVDVSRTGAGWRVVAEVTAEPARIGTLQLPSLRLSLRNEGGATSAHFALSDARGQLEGDLTKRVDGVELTARFAGVSLGAWPELQGRVQGRLDGRAQAQLTDGRFSGSADGRLSAFAAGDATLAGGSWRGRFDGSLAAPGETQLELSLTGDDVRYGPLRFEQARATGRGAWHTSRIQAELTGAAGAKGTARARLGLRDRARVDDLHISWADRGLLLDAHVERWVPESGLLSLDRLVLTGRAGSLQATAELAPGHVQASASAERLDTDVAARALGMTSPGLRGVFSGNASLLSTGSEARGELALKGEKVRVQNLSVGAVDARVTLAGQHVEIEADARDASLGRLELRGTGELGGRPLELVAWQRATGSGSVALSQLPLWPVGLLLAQQGRVKSLDGRLDVGLKLDRRDPNVLPNIFFQANTHELTFALAGDATGAPERAFDQYAVHASASITGHGGHGAATLLVTDEHGALVTTSGALDVDLESLLRDPQTILARLFRTPLDALVRLHPRPISLLPPPFDVRDLAGGVEATVQLRGSLAEPTLSLAAQGHQLQGGVTGADRAVDVTSVLEYTPKDGRLRGTAEVARAGRSLVSARIEGRVPNPLDPASDADALELRAAAMLNGVPLELIPVAARERVEAQLYGSVDIEQEPGEPLRQRAHLEIANLTARGHALGNGRLTFESQPAGLRADLRVGSRDHFLRATVRGPGSSAGSAATITGSLDAREFDAASLSPLTSGLLSRVGGSMNADLEFELQPNTDSDWYLGIDGTAALRGGSAHIEELGLEVRDIEAQVNARKTPEYTVLQIDPLSAKARSRTPNVKGDVELWLRGLRVMTGEANLTLSDVPLSLKGVSRGIARGQVKARLERQPDHLSLQVKLPDLRVRLPPSSTRTLIALEPNPDLRVIQAAEERDPAPRDALLWKIQLDLDGNVRIQRGDLDVPLTGHPRIEYQYEVRPSGTIEALPGGRIRLFDQSFAVERGLVQFVPDEPDNPRVDFTASWRAPDGTTVYVDVTGRAQDATVLTRDDRGLQEVERFYLITGGAVPEGRDLADGGVADAGALGQTFSLGINELLRDSLGNVAVSIGTTPDDRASYSASVRLTDKLSFQGSFQPASQTNLQESTNDLTGTLDYRFSRRWSLRTELGTSGGAFDMLWSHRY